MNHTVLHPKNQKYPVKQDYQLTFLKFVINKLENQGLEIHDCLYELLTQKLNEVKIDKNEFAHKHYLLENDEIVTIKESTSFIRNGTTGLKVWQAALALSEFIMTEKCFFNDKVILEIGSGIGLVGLVLLKACKPKKVFMSDCHDNVLEILRENISINTSEAKIEPIESSSLLVQQRFQVEKGPEIGVFNLPWEDIETYEDDIKKICVPDCILAADVVYDESLFNILISCISKLFEIGNNKVTLYLATTIRNETTYFGFKYLLGELISYLVALKLRFLSILFIAEENGFVVKEQDSVKANRFYWDDESAPIKILKITHS